MEGKGKIYAAMIAVMQEIEPIAKTRDNKQQGFKFRGIDEVYMSLQPLLAKHGIFCMPEVVEEKREERQSKSGGVLMSTILKVKYTFYAEDGSSVSACPGGEGMDSGDKSYSKAMAIAHKYCLFQAFCIPTADGSNNDPDKDSHDLAPKRPAAPLPTPFRDKIYEYKKRAEEKSPAESKELNEFIDSCLDRISTPLEDCTENQCAEIYTAIVAYYKGKKGKK